jgi:GNAT superfamily N-acetyltransferase
MTTVREMPVTELGRIAEIDRSERIVQQYRARGSALELVDVDIRASRWSEAGVQHHLAEWSPLLDAGGVLLGAFDGERLVGVAVYDRSLPDEPARLAALYVSRSHRGRRLGRALTDRVIGLARADGAARLYVSATPTRATVDFYIAAGFEPLATPNAQLLALEPEDIHLALPL